jgi:signal transduction histidine kinase
VALGTDEYPLLLANLPPSAVQRRLALGIVAVFIIGFIVTAPMAHTPLPRVDAWIPAFATALVITDLLTSVLLFAQFSIVHSRSLLVLAIGYCFSAFIVIPYTLTFPGLLSPTGLLGADLQSAVWLYVIWHIASPLSVIVYELAKDATKESGPHSTSARTEIGWSIVIVIALLCLITWFVTAQHDLLPQIYIDRLSLAPLANVVAALIFLLCAVALALLWIRGRSVIDLWLIVTVSAWLLEITLQGLFLTPRFSLAWYVGRVYSLIAGSVVLIVLLSETTTLYAHLARSVVRQRAVRQARQIAMDTMAASIAHEVNQPLGAIALNAEAALLRLSATPPNTAEVRAALEDIVIASARGGQVIAGVRAMFKERSRVKTSFDVNDVILEILRILEVDLRAESVSVSTALHSAIPLLSADRGQLQQVLLNLVVNATEAMRSVNDRPRRLRISSDVVPESADIIIAVEDTGAGIDSKVEDRIFEPFFTTKPTGMGIGLTVCRSIIGAHGGSLRALANKPYGTILEVVIPASADGSDNLGGGSHLAPP